MTWNYARDYTSNWLHCKTFCRSVALNLHTLDMAVEFLPSALEPSLLFAHVTGIGIKFLPCALFDVEVIDGARIFDWQSLCILVDLEPCRPEALCRKNIVETVLTYRAHPNPAHLVIRSSLT